MSQPAKVQEPTMEEILASIRRIIADDDATKPPAKPAEAAKPAAAAPAKVVPPPPPPPKPAPPPAAAPQAKNNQDDIDAMLAELDAASAGDDATMADEPDDVLDLTESMAAPAQPAGFRTIDGRPDVVFEEKPAPPPPPAAARPTNPSMVDLARRQFEQELGVPSLLSASTSAAVDSAFNSLANTVLVQNARTLEDLVKEMLRPMLKGWLDDNLPLLVERLVRAEIDRVSRGRHQ
jgi:cell pole-organizing protein PopZ